MRVGGTPVPVDAPPAAALTRMQRLRTWTVDLLPGKHALHTHCQPPGGGVAGDRGGGLQQTLTSEQRFYPARQLGLRVRDHARRNLFQAYFE